MTYRVELTLAAKFDADEAYLWWALHRSPEQAGRWYQAFLGAMQSLSQSPERMPYCQDPKDRARDLRELLFGVGNKVTHRLFFRVSGQTVSIVRVRHYAQQI